MCRDKRGWGKQALMLLVVVMLFIGIVWTTRQECAKQRGMSVVERRPRNRSADIVDIMKGLMLDNSPPGKRLRADKIRYLIRDNGNSSWRDIKKTGKEAGKQWKIEGEVKLIIHGLTPWLNKTADEKIVNTQMGHVYDAYKASNQNLNVILIDWTELSSYTTSLYWQAVDSVPFAADGVADFLCHLKRAGMIVSYEDVHVVAFALGAHVAGAIGERVHSRTGESLGRITGLDPAGHLSMNGYGGLPPNLTNVLDSTDATFVDVIHCNMDKLFRIFPRKRGSGTSARRGHVDIFRKTNGGRVQSGCSGMNDEGGCSHRACPHLFVESINAEILACKCGNWLRFLRGLCPCTPNSSRAIWFG